MIINLMYHREQALRSLERGHPYYSHASSVLWENLQWQKIGCAQDFQRNVVSLVHKGSQMGGTGILLNREGFLLTSLHLLNHLRSERYRMRDYIVRDIEGRESALDPSFFASEEDYDLAILRTFGDHDSLPTIPLGFRDPDEAEKLVYFPFPNGREALMLEGLVEESSCDIEVVKTKGEDGPLRRDCFVFQGKGDSNYSGTGIFSNQGEYLGTLFSGDNPGRSSTMYAIKSAYARRLVQSIRSHLREC